MIVWLCQEMTDRELEYENSDAIQPWIKRLDRLEERGREMIIFACTYPGQYVLSASVYAGSGHLIDISYLHDTGIDRHACQYVTKYRSAMLEYLIDKNQK